LWFCFYEPSLAGERGIGRLFRSWGGEALYNSHEKDPTTGGALRRIGVPCIIKAIVPINNLCESKFPDSALARVILSRLGHQIRTSIKHDGYSTQRLPASQILGIFEPPKPGIHCTYKVYGMEQICHIIMRPRTANQIC